MRLLVLWALSMAPLLGWGLPDRSRDELLFGGEPAWKAARYRAEADLLRLRTRQAGADTDLNPLPTGDVIVDLTADDAARAEILRRYRLYSRQPDEMIIFRALQRMNPRELDFDPRLYQYGGGYIYLIGAALRVAAWLGLVHLAADVGAYLEHPELFARFYIVARALSLLFGAATLVAVFRLARRAGGRTAGWMAAACAAGSPVFITAVLEAKPHLPSACLILWATLSALDYRARGRWRDAIRLGLRAGYGFALVLTGVVSVALWPVLLTVRRAAARRRALCQLAAAGGLASGVYVLCNPYVVYNWLTDRAALTSNISNSLAMYRDQVGRAASGAVRVAQLLLEGAGIGVLLTGALGLVALLRRYLAATVVGVAPGVVILVIAVLLGAGKPAEYARFLILPILLLCIASGALLASLSRSRAVLGMVATVAVWATLGTVPYLRSFVTDARGDQESRLLAARYLRQQMTEDHSVGVLQEPAPYAVPPLDFAHCQVSLLPVSRPVESSALLPTWLVFTADDDRTYAGAWWQAYYQLAVRFPPAGTPLSRIAWANKPTYVYRRAP